MAIRRARFTTNDLACENFVFQCEHERNRGAWRLLTSSLSSSSGSCATRKKTMFQRAGEAILSSRRYFISLLMNPDRTSKHASCDRGNQQPESRQREEQDEPATSARVRQTPC